MRRLFLAIIASTFCLSPVRAQQPRPDSLYRCLDEAIAHSADYVAEKQRAISGLRMRLRNSVNDADRYVLSRQLYDEYMPFLNDSAIVWIQQCITLAERIGRKQDAAECRALLALQCSNTGMFDEAQAVLREIKEEDLDSVALGRYYEACHHVFSELAFYSRVESMKQLYGQKSDHYAQLMLRILPEGSDARFVETERRLLDAGQLKESMQVNDKWLKHVEKGSHRYALTALYRYLEYKAAGDTTQMMCWIAESAIADVRNAVMNQGSMWEIANQLMLQGENARAYRYVSFASDCAARFGSRVRYWQLSPLLTAIDRNYQAQNERTSSKLRLLLATVSVLALLFVISLFYVNRQRKKLSTLNGQLSTLNTQLSASNLQLSTVNSQLSTLNYQLSEASKVKEEYIGRFLRLCSLYIDKMDQMRKRVNKMLKNRDYEELSKMARSVEIKDRELDELYGNFDTAFLHLFPHFVEDFNALLKPEERIQLDDAGRLNTSIRIFALIRLGIDDSSKIAEFLHYSVNTIYNYRARVKNGALNDRENFEQRVREIGMPK